MIFDELNKTTYLKKYYNFFNKDVSKFVSSDLLDKEIDENFNDEKTAMHDEVQKNNKIKSMTDNDENHNQSQFQINCNRKKLNSKLENLFHEGEDVDVYQDIT